MLGQVKFLFGNPCLGTRTKCSAQVTDQEVIVKSAGASIVIQGSSHHTVGSTSQKSDVIKDNEGMPVNDNKSQHRGNVLPSWLDCVALCALASVMVWIVKR